MYKKGEKKGGEGNTLLLSILAKDFFIFKAEDFEIVVLSRHF